MSRVWRANVKEGEGTYDTGGKVRRKETRPLGRPRRRWVDNIKTDLREIEWGGMDWIYLAQDRYQCRAFVSTAMNLRVP
jgi:hypothetical protein